jgi:4-amino-4-deoxy-L-arabinose transferase-like glycosyltransferase
MQIFAHNDSTDKPTRIQITVWVGLVVAMIFLSLVNYQAYQLGTHFDDSRYVILAQSLISSSQYGMINAPGQPGPGKYPFGYPFFLVPPIILFPGNSDALKLPSLIATILNLVILFWGWRWFSKSKSYWWAIAVAGLYALSPLTIDHTRRVMSEPIFTTFCLIAIILAEQAAQGKQNHWWRPAISAALMFAAFTRTIGIVLVASVLAYLLLVRGRGFWKEIVLILVQIVFMLGLIVVVTPVQLKDLLPLEYLKEPSARFLVAPFADNGTGDPVPGDQTAASASQTSADTWNQKLEMARNLLYRGIRQHFGSDIRAVALPIGGGEREQKLAEAIGIPTLPSLSGYLVSALVIFGLARVFAQEKVSLFLLFGVLYFLVLFLWDWNDPRLLYPIQPQLHFGLLAALEGVIFWVVTRVRRMQSSSNVWNSTFPSLVFLLMTSFILKSSQIDDSRLHAGDIEARSSWLKTHSDASDIIMTEAPEPDYLYSGRKTVPYPFSVSSSNGLDDYLMRYRIKFILVAPKIAWQNSYKPEYDDSTMHLLPLITELDAENKVIQVYSLDQQLVKVYQVQPPVGSVEQ